MKKYFLLLIAIWAATNLYSQFADRQANFPQVSSPNVAAFNKYIDHPISLYNGTPDVSIPLYTVKDGKIELPITLRYNTSGIKVDEEASWVGLGWNLNVGGIISQNIMGYCDEEDTEYQNFLNTPEFTPFFDSSQPFKGYYRIPYTLGIHQKIGPIIQKRGWYSTHGLGKLEPDIFYFSYPGNAGKFMIDYRTDQIYILSREQNLKIEFLSNPRRFIITTTEGIKHTFARMFDITGDGIEGVTYGLESSVYPNNQTIAYEYEIVSNRSYKYYESYSTAYYDDGETIYPSYYGINGSPGHSSDNVKIFEGKEIILKRIKTTNYEISFITDSRIDLPKNTTGKKLIEIKITPREPLNSPQSKRFKLNYDYFNANYACKYWSSSITESTDWAGKRLKLINLYEISDAGIHNKYDFFYQETPLLPRKDSYAIDYWGYYNGNSLNSHLIPDLDMLLFNNPYYSKVLEAYRRGAYAKKYTGNRSYNFEYCKAAILTGIKYPTGGYLEFEFEPNTFSELGALSWQQSMPPNIGGPTYVSSEYSFIPTEQQYNGDSRTSINVKDQNSPQTTSIRSFTIEEKCNATVSTMLTPGNHTWQTLNQLMHFVHIKKINGTTKQIIHTIQMPSGSGSECKKESSLELNPGTYEIVADLSDALGNLLSGDYYYYGTALSATISYPKPKSFYPLFSTGCGLRIKNISHFKNKGDLKCSFSTSYEYDNPSTHTSSGVLHDLLNYVNVTRKLACIDVASPPKPYIPIYKLYAPSVVDIYSNNNVSNPYGNSSGVGYRYVKEIRKGENNAGYTLSKFKNEPGYFRYRQGGVKIDMPLNGKLEEESVYNDKGILIKKSKYNYTANPSDSYFSFTFRDTNLIPLANELVKPSDEWGYYYSMSNNPMGDKIGDRVLIYKTEINAYDILLTSKESVIDGVTQKEEYTYNPKTLQVKDKKISTEANTSIRYVYTYPYDYNCGVYSQMTTRNMISNVIEEKIFRNDNYIGSTLSLFRLSEDGNKIVPDKTCFSEITTQLTDQTAFTCNGLNTDIYPHENVQYKAYDNYNNPVYIIYNDKSQIVYLWSYNGQYPIAEIRNATYDEVNAAVKSLFPVADINALSTLNTPNEAKLKDGSLQKALPNAQVTTYTYSPLIGMLTQTDPRGVITDYEYDGFNQLSAIYVTENGTRRKLETYDYHYQNQ